MTLFTAFFVPDGIVVVSDSRITLNKKFNDGTEENEVLSDQEQKIFLLRNNDVCLVSTSENMPDGFTMVEFINNMNKFIIKRDDSIWDITLKIKSYINEVPGIKISIVIAGYDNGEPYLFLIENKNIKVLNRTEDNKVFYGATIGGNFRRIDEVFDYERKFDDFTTEKALEYGIYLVEDSIKYLNDQQEYSDVGGDIQYLEMKKTGSVSLVRWFFAY